MNPHNHSFPIDLQPRPNLDKHHRQTTWQILIPLIIASVLILFLSIKVVIITSSGTMTGLHWANISIIWLIIPFLYWGILALVILIAVIYGLSKMIQTLPYYSLKARFYSNHVKQIICCGADQSVQPILTIKGWRAGWRSLVSRYSTKKHIQ